MFINKEGKLFGKISIIDIAVVVCVILAVAVIGAKFVFPGSRLAGGSMKDCEYTVTVQNIRQESVDAINKSMDLPWFDVNDVEIGKIKEIISIEPYEKELKKSDGSMVLAPVPERYTVKFRMAGKATKGNCAAMLGGKREAMHGSHITIESPEIALEVLITDVVIAQ